MADRIVVALKGQAGSGKDSVADYLVKHHGYTKLAFADPVKRFVHEVFGVPAGDLWGESSSRNKVVQINWYNLPGHLIDGFKPAWITKDYKVNHTAEEDLAYVKWEEFKAKHPTEATVRDLLIAAGDDVAKVLFSDQVWADSLWLTVDKLSPQEYTYSPTSGLHKISKKYKFVVADTRFACEYAMLKDDLDAKFMNIIGNFNKDQTIRTHRTETELLDFPTHAQIRNDRPFAETIEAVKMCIEMWEEEVFG